MLFNPMVTQVLLYRGNIPLNACNKIEKNQIMFLRRRLELNLLGYTFGTNVRLIEMLALQVLPRYITKIKNMVNHRLPHLA